MSYGFLSTILLFEIGYSDSQNGHTNEFPSIFKGTSTSCFTQLGHLVNLPMYEK